MGGGEGKEGDWECGSCENRNYAFRSFCNRCKQPRLLVDSKTPADSKWLPRIGDWICTGCTNNNYASREKCKKCGQPKELTAMPALAMHGPTLQTHPHYFARVQGLQHQQPIHLSPNWLLGVPDKYGVSASTWPMGPTNNVPYVNQVSQVPKGWRSGDWICTCGFHNYSSRAQCKKCDASMPPALGTKRSASEDLGQDWDNKRLNAGQQAYLPLGPISSSTFLTPFQMVNSSTNPQMITMPSLPGKGAKQWRDGDWMCTNCDNHNYASRSHCNKCNTQKEGLVVPVSVA
ncbi:ranBP2-type zinc finger protein At1g67325 isoform X2 [Rutidosis leptorrhynchoides]|uniref:ranBP2-type zinc finger protein At1g67325 isoform X2 n=1 Tax=Rutidosis leptorrhynchoides TaxID=125765 RepID=UPI003A9942E4